MCSVVCYTCWKYSSVGFAYLWQNSDSKLLCIVYNIVTGLMSCEQHVHAIRRMLEKKGGQLLFCSAASRVLWCLTWPQRNPNLLPACSQMSSQHRHEFHYLCCCHNSRSTVTSPILGLCLFYNMAWWQNAAIIPPSTGSVKKTKIVHQECGISSTVCD